MTEEIMTTDNNQKMSAYCKTCICKSCEQVVRLEQENKELKNRNVELQITLNEFDRFNNYRSALEEILEIVRTDCKGCTAECDCDEDCTRYMITNKINECLGE